MPLTAGVHRLPRFRDRGGYLSTTAGSSCDAFRPFLKLARREALRAIKALRDEPFPLFAKADARAGSRATIQDSYRHID
jgi:hypothetical protein